MTGLERGLRRVMTGRAAGQVSLLAVLVGGTITGAAMGSYAGRPTQMAYSAIKVPVLLALTAGLALPGFFVLNTLLGLRGDWPRVLRAIALAPGVVALSLSASAPVVLVGYASGVRYPVATLLNGLAFVIACLAAQWRLRRAYRPLIARDRRHRLMLSAWLIVYTFVGIQLAWVLRPFVGDPWQEPTFFRSGAWGNAYEVVAELLLDQLGGSRGSP